MFQEAAQGNILLPGPSERRPWPKAGEKTWESLSQEKQDALLAWGHEAMQEGYPVLLATQFMRFVRDGDRKVFENPYFTRRRNLIGVALSECLIHDDKKIDFIVDGLWLICEETSWILSAHNNKGNPGDLHPPLPDKDAPIIDLFAAQTASTVAVIYFLLKERLDAVTPLVTRRVMQELEKRIFEPFMRQEDFWWMGLTRLTLNNWTPWIVSNVLVSAQYVMDDTQRLHELVYKACQILDRYRDCLPEDGGCDEGTAYWNMAGGSLLDCLESLREMSGGNLDFYDDVKVHELGLFPLRTHVAGSWFWNFADCDAQPMLEGERIYTYGKRIQSPALQALGQSIHPQLVPKDTPQIGRVLNALFTDMQPAQDPEPLDQVQLPHLQVWARKIGRMYTVIKGGHNGESHNHNDIGSFMIYVDGQPIVVDAGNMVYTRKTFSSERYTLWNTRSMYHNVPLIGSDGEQQAGNTYKAHVLEASDTTVSLELKDAYPQDLRLEKLQRTLTFGDSIHIQDVIVLHRAESITWVFMTYVRPVILNDTIVIGPMTLSGMQTLQAIVEEIPVTDARMAANFPGTLYRLTLTASESKEHLQDFTFSC